MANNIFQKYGLGSVLSDSNGLDYDTIVEALEEGTIPDGVTVYFPFENEDTRSLANLIEENHDIFRAFAEELDERRERGED